MLYFVYICAGESNAKCNSTLHLTSFKEGKEIVWMKERARNGDSEQDGLGHADFMNGEAASQPSDDFHHPGASSVVRSETPEKTAKSDGEIGAVFVDSFDSGYKSVTEKGHSGQDPVVSKKKKKVKKHKKELSPDQGKISTFRDFSYDLCMCSSRNLSWEPVECDFRY